MARSVAEERCESAAACRSLEHELSESAARVATLTARRREVEGKWQIVEASKRSVLFCSALFRSQLLCSVGSRARSGKCDRGIALQPFRPLSSPHASSISPLPLCSGSLISNSCFVLSQPPSGACFPRLRFVSLRGCGLCTTGFRPRCASATSHSFRVFLHPAVTRQRSPGRVQHHRRRATLPCAT